MLSLVNDLILIISIITDRHRPLDDSSTLQSPIKASLLIHEHYLESMLEILL